MLTQFVTDQLITSEKVYIGQYNWLFWQISLGLHFFQQGDHSKCNQGSRCQEDSYECSKKPLVSERAIAAYRKAVEGTTIFKNAEDYALVIYIDNYDNNIKVLMYYSIY